MSNAEATHAALGEELNVPVIEEADVVVCGGGPAGIAAAIAAAQTQRHLGITPNVRLIETHGQLGGIWTSGLLCWILDARNKSGLMQQILNRVEAYRVDLGGRPSRKRGGQLYDAEHMKVLLEEMCEEAGVRIRLHTRVVAAHQQNGRLTHIVTESKSGREAFAARCFIDCTGDGDLAAQAGCSYEIGRIDEGSSTPVCQPMTLMALITGVDREAIRPFYDRHQYSTLEVKRALRAEFERAGVTPSYGHPTLFEVYPDLFALMSNHEYERNPLDAQAITDATISARREIHRVIEALRQSGGPWQNLRVVATAAQIGIRESRRPAGLYRICLDDLIVGRRHDDAVCECSFPIDVHATSSDGDRSVETPPVPKTLPYDIPFRALVARDVDGLLMAGRCISGDFYAHASYRVTGNAVPMGEAAGCAAALAVSRCVSPRDLDYPGQVRPIQRELFDKVDALESGNGRHDHELLMSHAGDSNSSTNT